MPKRALLASAGGIADKNPVKVITQDKIYLASWQVAKKPNFILRFGFSLELPSQSVQIVNSPQSKQEITCE